MPKQVLPDLAGFEWLERRLREYDFRSTSKIEFQKDFLRLKLEAPRPQPGREAGFMFFANGLTVRVWTTWLRFEGKAREVDAGWVLIADGDQALYFNHSRRRTKHFLENLFMEATLAHTRVLHRPLCPACNQLMNIVRGKALKSRYWRCDRVECHEDRKPRTKSWDHGLSKEEKLYVKNLRKQRKKYRATQRKKGKNPFAALLKRRPW